MNVIKNLKDTSVLGDIDMESNEEIISRLKFIGHIQKNEKINVRHVNRQPNNWVTTLSRSLLFPDNRSNALKFLRDVINRSFEIIDQALRKQNFYLCKGMISDLVKSQHGLLNMKFTYSDDTKFCCDIDVLIERIVSRLSDMQKDLPNLFEESMVEAPVPDHKEAL